LDSLGIGAVEIGRIIAPNLSLMSPASAEAHSGDSGGVFAFFAWVSTAWGPGGSPLFIPCAGMSLGGLKEQDIRRWLLTTRVIFPFQLFDVVESVCRR
jgi:hypothetical protein